MLQLVHNLRRNELRAAEIPNRNRLADWKRRLKLVRRGGSRRSLKATLTSILSPPTPLPSLPLARASLPVGEKGEEGTGAGILGIRAGDRTRRAVRVGASLAV